MNAPVLLTGGTGTLGRLVAPLLRASGRPVRMLSRRPQPDNNCVTGDLSTGAGVDAAVAGVATVVHCAGSAKGDDEKARVLVRAAARAGVEHLVFVSVVGADRVPVVGRADRAMFGYFAAKRAAEEIIAESGIPWTTLRAAQFHELIVTVARGLAKLPVLPVPAGVRYQPVDARDVAERLAELALDQPAGLVPDLSGPAVHPFDGLVRGYLTAAHKRRLLLPVRLGGKAAAAIRAGANLATDGTVGTRTWEAFLAERVRP